MAPQLALRNLIAERIIAAFADPRCVPDLRALGAALAPGGASLAAEAAAPLLASAVFAERPRAAGRAASGIEEPAGSSDRPIALALGREHEAARSAAADRVRRALGAVESYWSRHAALEADLPTTLERAAALFNARLYFEVHEILERLWNTLEGDVRRFVQGLIQIAVAFHHLENGNRAGARTLLAEGRAKIAPHAPAYHGVTVDALLAALTPWQQALATAPSVSSTTALAHPLLLVAPAAGRGATVDSPASRGARVAAVADDGKSSPREHNARPRQRRRGAS